MSSPDSEKRLSLRPHSPSDKGAVSKWLARQTAEDFREVLRRWEPFDEQLSGEHFVFGDVLVGMRQLGDEYS